MCSITFINIPIHPNTVMTVYPPVGILSMSGCLKSEGFGVDFIDADVLRLDSSEVVERLKKAQPDIIGITLNVSQVSNAESYINDIKNSFPKTPVVIGGPYVTGVQEKVFQDFPSLNYAIINEGEYAIMDFVKFIEGKVGIKEVRNLIYKIDGQIKKNRSVRIMNLDSLPFPDYSLVMDTLDKYSGPEPSLVSSSIAIICTRGCPYNCSFCSSPGNWDRRVTYRSADSIIDEIVYLKETLHVKEIFFQDDTLNVRADWFFELCEKIISHGLNKDIFFKCSFKANEKILTKEILQQAKEANFWMIFYGVESGNQEMLEKMNKNVTTKEVKRAFKLTRQAGIASYASFMIGNLGETKKTVWDSIKLLKKITPDYGGFAITVPFPGSELFRIGLEKNLIIDRDFKHYHYGDCILKTDELSAADICSLAEKANNILYRIQKSFKYKMINHKTNKFIDTGVYPEEFWHTFVNRTGRRVRISLPKYNINPKDVVLRIIADYPDIIKRAVVLHIKVNKSRYKIRINDINGFP